MIFTAFSQRDSRWSAQRLGTCDGVTIGSSGCLLTSVTMMVNAFRSNELGPEMFPNQLDDWLTSNNGYSNGCELNWDALSRLPDNDANYCGYMDAHGIDANLSDLNNRLDSGQLAICEVRYGGVETNMHFVLIAGRVGDWDYTIYDPWNGDTCTFASGRFGSGSAAKDIYGLHFYSDATPDVVPPIPAPQPAPAPLVLPNQEAFSTEPVVPPVAPVMAAPDPTLTVITNNGDVHQIPNPPADPVPGELPLIPLTPSKGVSNIQLPQSVKDFLGSLLSRKFLLPVFFTVLALANVKLGLGLSDSLMGQIFGLGALFIGAEGSADALRAWKAGEAAAQAQPVQ